MPSCFPFLRRRRSKTCSWRQLLTFTGPDLWAIRKKALDDPCVKLLIDGHHQSAGSVCVLSSISRFKQAEEEHGMDKIVTKGGPRPLTVCTGDEWIRQRKLVQRAFIRIPDRSLIAVEPVNFRNILKDNSKVVDLKQVVLDASLGWLVRLFRGQDDENLEQACLCFWREVRARQKKPMPTKKAREEFVRSLKWDGGVLGEISNSGLSSKDQVANAVNAMIAALDAVQSLVFWTIWNLARTDGAWQKCRRELLLDENETLQQQDLSRLAEIKKLSTQGKSIQWAGLTFLGRSLAETVRVYPPVWTLPRTWPCGSTTVASKLDIPTTNLALDRDWDPTHNRSVFVASFGLGKRACPAGTAALYAAYVMIRSFVLSFESAAECDAGKAIRSAYLGPTLCVQGPQNFHLEPSAMSE